MTHKPTALALIFALTALASPIAQAQNSFGAPSNQGTRQSPNQPSNQAPNQSPNQSPNKAPSQFEQPNQVARPDPSGRASPELKDHGVAATNKLHAGAMHGPTPTSIPGGQVITTPGLVQLLKMGGVQALVFDVLGGPDRLPNAQSAVPAHQAGSFDDSVQREFGQYLNQVTQGKQDVPLVFYCGSTMCWMSYNAALRAVNMGYRNVLWYRGGLEAKRAAGQPVQSARQAPQTSDGTQLDARR